MEVITITIKNWGKYQPRKDYKKPTWFALNNRILEDSDFFSFEPEEFKVWIYLLCQASQHSCGKIRLNLEHAKRICNLSEKIVRSTLAKLLKINVICTDSVRDLYGIRTPHNITEHNNTIQGEACTENGGSKSTRKSKNLQPANAAAHEGVNEVVGLYCKLWKERYQDNPVIRGKTAGQLRSLVKDVGKNKALLLIEAYLRMPDQWFVTKRHDISTFEANLNSVTHFLATGKIVTRLALKSLEEKVDEEQGTRPRDKTMTEILAERELELVGGDDL